MELLFNGIKYVDCINSNNYNDSLLNVREQVDSWIKVGNIVYIHKGVHTGHIGIVKGHLPDGKWLVHLTSKEEVVAAKLYGHEFTLVSNATDSVQLEQCISNNDELTNQDNVEDKTGKRKDRPDSFKSLSPHSKSKKKKLSSLVVQDSSSQQIDHSNADPEDESNEARNNLYWIKDKLLPCLWYGNSTTNPDDMVDVLPIKVYDSSENIKLPKTTALLKVKRRNLIPLEPELLRKQCTNEDAKQFSLALLDFAEYDDYSRDSYLWPGFIVTLLENPRACQSWIADARSLKVASQFKEDSKLFLYYLSAKLMGEYDDPMQEGEEEDNDNLKYLLNMTNSLVDNTSKDFKRSSSRYGEEYQALLPSLDERSDDDENPSSIAFIADKVSDDVLDEYMKVVHALRIRHVSCGHIIEAPPAIFGDPPQETSSQYSSYLNTGQLSPDIRKTPTRKRKGTKFVVATVTAKKPSKHNESNDLLSSCQNDPATSYDLGSLIDDKKLYDVEVFDGATTWTVPLSSCHILSMPDDKAYEHLHKWNYDVKTALQMIEAELVIDRVFEKGNWPSKSLESFVKAALPYGFPSRDQLDVRELMETYNEVVDQKNKDIVSANSIANTDNSLVSKSFVKKSFLELTDLVHRYFQGHRAENVAHHLDQLTLKRRPPISLLGSAIATKRTPFSEKPTNDNEPNTSDNKIKSTSSSSSSNNNNSSKKKKRKSDGPHRWPSSMPLMLHNIYWLRSNNQPCLCLGVDTVKRYNDGIYLRVISICSSTAHHEVSVSVSSLEPLTELNIKQCQDEKSVAFTLAMIDFSEWEYDKIKLENPNSFIRWYEYPQFVRTLLLHSPSWKAWRAQVERNARGKREDKRTIYFEALKEELNIQDVDDRRMDEYPWDDTPLSDESEDEPENKKNDSDDNNEKKKPREKKDPDDKEKKRKIEIYAPPEPPKKNFSPFNLYWIQRSELPCIYLDIPENRDGERFKVLPVCCGTYHYPVRVTFGDVEPLTITCLKRCREERTHDFALALMGFAAWDLTQKMQQHDENGVNGDGYDVYLKAEQKAIHIMHEDMNTHSSEVPFYEWPEFIPRMINNPREWQSWRKRVERGAQQNKDQTRGANFPKKQLYFAALVEDFKNRSL